MLCQGGQHLQKAATSQGLFTSRAVRGIRPAPSGLTHPDVVRDAQPLDLPRFVTTGDDPCSNILTFVVRKVLS